MWIAYLLAFLPVLIGGILWALDKRVVFVEWVSASILGLVTSAIFHVVAVTGMTADVEIWSGRVTGLTYNPEWVEKYKEAIYKNRTKTVSYTDSKGRSRTRTETERVFSHYEDRYRTHSRYWTADLNFGSNSDQKTISESTYHQWKKEMGGGETGRDGNHSGFYSGDPRVYGVSNQTAVIIPVTQTKTWENRGKAAPSVFSFPSVPKGIGVFEYPSCSNWASSDRLLGLAPKEFTARQWDTLNAEVGPSKKANLILVGFNSPDTHLGRYQEAKWVGGRKNDLVICYGKTEGKVAWVYAFGWTEQEQVKRNLETLLLNQWEKAEQSDGSLLQKIKDEVTQNYRIKDWKKFDYLTVEPPWWSYIILLVIMSLVQGAAWFHIFTNEARKIGGVKDASKGAWGGTD